MSPPSPIQPNIFRLLGLVPIVAVILAIIGGIDQSSSKPSTVSSGVTLVRAGVILFLVIFIIFAAITLATFLKLRALSSGEERLLYALALSIPFILVRLIYSVIVDYAGNPQFNLVTGDVVIQACMASLMEFIVVILYLSAGLVAPKIARSNMEPLVSQGETGYNGQQSGRQHIGQENQECQCCLVQPVLKYMLILNPAYPLHNHREGEHAGSAPQYAAPSQQYMDMKPQYTQGGRRSRRRGPIRALISRYT